MEIRGARGREEEARIEDEQTESAVVDRGKHFYAKPMVLPIYFYIK